MLCGIKEDSASLANCAMESNFFGSLGLIAEVMIVSPSTSYRGRTLEFTATVNPGNVPGGPPYSTSITAAGVEAGDYVQVSFGASSAAWSSRRKRA